MLLLYLLRVADHSKKPHSVMPHSKELPPALDSGIQSLHCSEDDILNLSALYLLQQNRKPFTPETETGDSCLKLFLQGDCAV